MEKFLRGENIDVVATWFQETPSEEFHTSLLAVVFPAPPTTHIWLLKTTLPCPLRGVKEAAAVARFQVAPSGEDHTSFRVVVLPDPPITHIRLLNTTLV